MFVITFFKLALHSHSKMTLKTSKNDEVMGISDVITSIFLIERFYQLLHSCQVSCP